MHWSLQNCWRVDLSVRGETKTISAKETHAPDHMMQLLKLLRMQQQFLLSLYACCLL